MLFFYLLSLILSHVVLGQEGVNQYFGQYLQDGALHLAFFSNFRHGFFVEVGAANGVTYSNTLFFERTLGWTGINIEPHKQSFDQLVVNRPNSINLNVAIDNENSESEFVENTGFTTMLSGMTKHFHPDHMQRLYVESLENGLKPQIMKVFTRTLRSIFNEYDVKRIHFLSIDIEGGEWTAIQSIDFTKVYIDVIMFEAQYEEVKALMIDYLMFMDIIMSH
jgi:FkbM family methyltransferase